MYLHTYLPTQVVAPRVETYERDAHGPEERGLDTSAVAVVQGSADSRPAHSV